MSRLLDNLVTAEIHAGGFPYSNALGTAKHAAVGRASDDGEEFQKTKTESSAPSHVFVLAARVAARPTRGQLGWVKNLSSMPNGKKDCVKHNTQTREPPDLNLQITKGKEETQFHCGGTIATSKFH